MKITISKSQWQWIGKKAGWMGEPLCDCPKCGKPSSATDGTFCGECEAKYRTEQRTETERRMAELEKEISACPCHSGEEYCRQCRSRMVELMELKGVPEGEIAQFINQ